MFRKFFENRPVADAPAPADIAAKATDLMPAKAITEHKKNEIETEKKKAKIIYDEIALLAITLMTPEPKHAKPSAI